MKQKALFLFAGLGGYAYPFYESNNYDITFIEYLPELCVPLQNKYPNTKVICEDAIKYLERNYKDFDFIFASPPCVANSRINLLFSEKRNQYKRLPSLLPLEIKIFLDTNFSGKYIIENTIPYYTVYKEIYKDYSIVGRHLILANFTIPTKKKTTKPETYFDE